MGRSDEKKSPGPSGREWQAILPRKPFHAMRTALGLLFLTLFSVPPVEAQSPKREFRGAWIATVGNIDWPVRGASAASQQQALVAILDVLKAAGMNAVMFQIRPESDALYRSSLEPWSYWLTGEQGRDPGYDPLAFAIQEAHRRGMELHAWMNPYRVQRQAGLYATAPTHISRTQPSWVLQKGSLHILNPGRPEVRNYVARVVADVVRRYDVDAIHFDDYFYFEGIANEDAAEYQQYGAGQNLGDWRRGNVNRLVAQVNDSIRAIRPSVKFGISPSGIRRNADANTRGFESYSQIYADGLAWLQAKTIDYIVPQVYWYIGKPAADYAAVTNWWASVATERHLYVGHPAYKIGSVEDGSYRYTAADIGAQVRFNRVRPTVRGSVQYNTSSVVNNQGGVRDTLVKYYARPALPLVMPWKGDLTPPEAPRGLRQSASSGPRITLAWQRPSLAADGDSARYYALYRFPERPVFVGAPESSDNLVAVFGGGVTTYTDTPPRRQAGYFYVLTALDENWNESNAGPEAFAVGADADALAAGLALDPPFPNPARGAVTLRYRLNQPARVQISVFDALGRRVADLEGVDAPAGPRVVVFDSAALAPGRYVIRLQAGPHAVTQALTVTR
jgi:uncharacterized lipoprotein YddW (UPF0748 family)